MHALSVAFGPTILFLLFKTEENAKTMRSKMLDGWRACVDSIEVEDDFGQLLDVRTKSLHGIIYENFELSKLAHVHRNLHMEHVRLATAKAAQADPALRSASMMAGPPMLTPMSGPNGFGR